MRPMFKWPCRNQRAPAAIEAYQFQRETPVMLTEDQHREVMALLPSDDGDDMAAINAILCSAFYLKGLEPVTKRGVHVAQTQWGTKNFYEYPGQLRSKTGWLTAPNYLGSLDDACNLVRYALGEHWIVDVQVRADGSTAQVHQFPQPCRKSKIWRSDPGLRGAAAAVVRCVLEITAPLNS